MNALPHHLPRARARVAVAVALGFAATASVGLDVARMKLPADAAQLQRHAVTGFGGFNRGRYALGDFAGEFERSESRLALFGSGFAANRGKSSFSVEGPGIGSPVAGECEFKENVVTVGVVTFDPKKLVYSCVISSDGSYDGRLMLGEPSRKTLKERMLAYELRRGEADIGGVRIDVESVHNFEGAKLTSQVPVGYTFAIGGKIVAGVELTDSNPTVLLDDALDERERVIAMTAALALSVLRDPANSALAE